MLTDRLKEASVRHRNKVRRLTLEEEGAQHPLLESREYLEEGGGASPSLSKICQAVKVLDYAFSKGREVKGTLSSTDEKCYYPIVALSFF